MFRIQKQCKKLWELINKIIGKTSDKSSIINYIKVNEVDILNEKEKVKKSITLQIIDQSPYF